MTVSVDGQDGLVKAASGYMMGTNRKSDACGDETGEKTVDLPTPKELIEIRQRKKVRKWSTCCWVDLYLIILIKLSGYHNGYNLAEVILVAPLMNIVILYISSVLHIHSSCVTRWLYRLCIVDNTVQIQYIHALLC